MNVKRILSSVPLFFVLTAIVLSGSIQHTGAQSYKKSVEYNDSLVISTQKRTFKRSGDKLLTIEIAKDTIKRTQLLTVRLLNPDFTVFRTFTRELPINKFVMYFHNGIDVIESIENDKPVFYWRYTCETDEKNMYFDVTTVLNEQNDSLYSIPVSFHGARAIDVGGKLKITGEHLSNDTIYFDINGWHGYSTMQVYTGSIYDFKTGVREFTFPKGVTFRQLAVIDDSVRILTDNSYMSMYMNKHPLGSEATCMSSILYNLDYSVYKVLDYDFSSTGINLSNLNYSLTYEPLYDGHNLYFLHSFDSNIKDDQGGVIGYTERYFFTDKNGKLIKMSEEPRRRPSSALWLPSRNETVFLNYNGVLLSCPKLDSIGTYTDYCSKEDGSVSFVKVENDTVRFMDEQLNVYSSFVTPLTGWSFSDMTQKNVVADSLLELVFTNNNNGVRVINEKGQVLVNEPDSTWKMDFMQYTPLFLMQQGHKYANLVDDSLGLWYRVAPLQVNVIQQEKKRPMSVQVYRQNKDSVLLVDSINVMNSYKAMLPEGTFFVRTASDSLPSTYYPSALLWENATPVAFTTDSLLELTVNQPANPKPLSLTDDGAVSGTLTCDSPSLLWSVDLNQVRVYAIRSSSGEVVAVGKLNNQSYSLAHLPYGTYELIMDIPGKRMLTKNTCVLSSGQKQGKIVFTVLNNGISGNVITGLTTQSSVDAFIFEPNPASDRVRFNASFEGSSIDLFDMAGRRVLTTTIQGGEVRVNQLPQGLYMVCVQSKEGVVRSMLRKK